MSRRLKRLRWPALLVALAATAAVGLTAFSGATATSGASGTPAAATASRASSTPAATVASSSSGKPVKGGTMVIAYQSDPDTFDPQVCYDATCWDNMEMMFNRLYDYKTNTTDLINQAAVAPPAISDGGKVYTIDVRPGMKFSNGKPVTAADFVYSFSRICDPATKSPVTSFWTVVKGCTAYGKHPVGSVPGIKAIGKLKLRITLTQPDGAFKYVLAMPQSSVIPAGSGAQQAKQPLGSGPYEFVSYTPGRSIILKRNPYYWDKPLPYTDGVTEHLGTTPQVEYLELQKGEIDLMGDPLPNSDYLNLINNASLKPQTVTRASLSTYFLTMNNKIKPFNNPLVREAVSYAINRKFLLKVVNGQGEPATGFIPKGVKGYTPTNLVHSQDVKKARALLAKAGYPHGFTTTMYSWNTQPWTNLDPQIQQQLQAIGITLKVDPIEQSAFFTLASTPNKAPMTLTFWVADYPDASDFFNALLSCQEAVAGGENYAFYCNRKVDALVAKGEANPANATRYYAAANKLMLADNPVVPLYYGSVTEVRGAKVGGFFANPIWDLMIDQYWLTKGGSSSSTSGGL